MSYTNLPTEREGLLGEIPAVAAAAGSYRTAPTWMSMENFHQAKVTLTVGDMAATSTLDMALLQAQDVNGTGSKLLKAITQLTAAGGDEHDVCYINLRTEEMDVQNLFTHICVRVRVGTAAVCFSVVAEGRIPRAAPVDTSRATEIIA